MKDIFFKFLFVLALSVAFIPHQLLAQQCEDIFASKPASEFKANLVFVHVQAGPPQQVFFGTTPELKAFVSKIADTHGVNVTFVVESVKWGDEIKMHLIGSSKALKLFYSEFDSAMFGDSPEAAADLKKFANTFSLTASASRDDARAAKKILLDKIMNWPTVVSDQVVIGLGKIGDNAVIEVLLKSKLPEGYTFPEAIGNVQVRVGVIGDVQPL